MIAVRIYRFILIHAPPYGGQEINTQLAKTFSQIIFWYCCYEYLDQYSYLYYLSLLT
jgi:hypothetical protein